MSDTYEPEGGNTPTPSTPPAPHHVRPVLLVLLGATVMVAIGVVVIRSGIPDRVPPPPGKQTIERQTSTMDTAHTTVRTISGYVTEVLTLNGMGGKRIKLSTSIAGTDGDVRTVDYAFFLPDTLKMHTIQGGDFITVSFEGEPSETEYVVVEKVESRKR